MRDDDHDDAGQVYDPRSLGTNLRRAVDGVATVAGRRGVTTSNRAAEHIVGHHGQGVAGHDVAVLMTGHDDEEHGSHREELGARDYPSTGCQPEQIGQLSDQPPIPIEHEIGTLHEGDAGGYRDLVGDVSERRPAEGGRDLDHAMLSAITTVQSRFIVDGDPRRAFDALLEQFLGLTGSEYGFIGEILTNEFGERYLKTQAITNIAWDDETGAFFAANAPNGLEFSNLQSLFGAVITSERPVIANHPASDPRSGGLPPGHPPLDAFLGVPFFMGNRMVGMVGIANRPGGFDDGVIEVLAPLTQTCANLVGAIGAKREREAAEAALKAANERLNATVDAVRRQNEQMRMLSDLEELLQTCESLDETAAVVSHMAERMFAGWAGAFYALDTRRELLEAASAWGRSEQVAELNSRDCIAMRRSRQHLSAGSAGPLNCRHVDTGRDVGICVPLVGTSETFGLFHLVTGIDEVADLDLSNVEGLANTVARRISVTLANLRLSDSLRDQSVRDPLTQLFNRRYMIETLERELRRAERDPGWVLSVVLIDIDHFKTFNDRYGHAAGDFVLTEVARALRSVTRPSDIPCRMGGEEFLVVLPGCDANVAIKRTEDILRVVRELTPVHEGVALDPVTISAGIASHPNHGSSPGELIGAADSALYVAKTTGRDCFAVAPD